ncbi:hypothetical protein [Nocardia paucivorans]|uniref:hypothetical protein n=1 Tax=Nocardia paucivorans TaxID=114259 RepID=UPI00059365D8|nr:hypothetical protein [Nocardia paucivorans]
MMISAGSAGWVPETCTLPTTEQPIRIGEFDRFFAESARSVRRPEPTRLELVVDPVAESVARDLAARESSCCSFFAFDFTVTTDGLVMGVEVPDVRIDVLDAFTTRAHNAIASAR